MQICDTSNAYFVSVLACTLTNWLTASTRVMYWEKDTCSSIKLITRLSFSTKFQYRPYKSPTLFAIMNHIFRVLTLLHSSFKIHSNIILPYRDVFEAVSFCQASLRNFYVHFSRSAYMPHVLPITFLLFHIPLYIWRGKQSMNFHIQKFPLIFYFFLLDPHIFLGFLVFKVVPVIQPNSLLTLSLDGFG